MSKTRFRIKCKDNKVRYIFVTYL